MKVGLSSFTFPWAVGVPGWPPPDPMGALDLLRAAVELGVGVVQIADNLPLDRLDEAELAALQGFAAEHGLELEVGTRGIGDHLVRYADLAVSLGSPFVRVVLDHDRDEPTVAEAITRLAAYEPAFRSRDRLLAIENHDRFATGQLLQIVDGLGDWVGVCLDTVNSLGALEPPGPVIAALGPRAVNVHLKDFTIRRHRHALGFEVVGTPLGRGRLDLPQLLADLAGWGRVRTAILELWTPLGDSLTRTIAEERAWAVESLDHLRATTALEFSAR